ncbi:MAG: bifunctional DNA primase/polymerase [Bacteroidota bacterium]|jgi:hypothetical protein
MNSVNNKPNHPGKPPQNPGTNPPPTPPPAGPHLNKIVIDANKRALVKWGEFQTRRITPDEFAQQKAHPRAHGEAVICGPISDGLEVIDIDTKADPARTLHNDYFSLIRPELFARLYIVQTRSGGAHIYFRCDTPGNCVKLAKRFTTESERATTPAPDITLIETKGAGGYVVAPPTPGYSILQGSPETIPFLSMDERAELLALAQSFHELKAEPEPLQPRTQQGGTMDTGNPFKEYNEATTPGEVRELLTGHGWTFVYSKGGKDFYRRPGNTDAVTSGDYHHEKRIFGVFTTNGHPFDAGKGYSPAGILNALQFAGDWKQTAAHLRRLGYGKPINGEDLKAVNRAAAMIRANKPAARIVDTLKSDHKVQSEDKAREIIQQAEQTIKDETGEFWQFTQQGGVKIEFTRFFQLLTGFGFARLAGSGSGKPVYIQTAGKIVREVTPGDIAAAVFDYLQKAAAPAEVENQFRQKAPALLSDQYLIVNLAAREIETVRDTEHTKYLPFINGLASMDQAGRITLIPYTAAPGYVWETHVIPHSFDPDPDIMLSLQDCEFFRFLECIAGETDKPGHDPRPRTDYALRVFGYLCETYKHPARPWCVILSEETADDNKGGGTGKSLFMKAVHHAAPLCTIPGKEYTPDNRFCLSRVNDATRVLFIDDVSKRFNFESLNNAITEGLRFERKGRDERFLPFAVSPKITVSTNYVLELDAEHAARRSRVFEFAPYFGRHRTPAQKFGHLFFEEWDQHEWNRFYNFVFYAVWQYRRHPDGLEVNPPSEATTIKAARLKHGREFVEWIQQVKHEYAVKAEPVSREDFYKHFQNDTGTNDKDYSKRRFFAAMDQAAAFLGLPFSNYRGENRVRAYKFYEPE